MKYRIECVGGDWTVRSENGYETYYFGYNEQDCRDWIEEHDGEIVDVIVW